MSIDTGQQTIHIGESGNRGGYGSIGLSGRRGIKGDVLILLRQDAQPSESRFTYIVQLTKTITNVPFTYPQTR